MADKRPRMRCYGCRRQIIVSGWAFVSTCWRCYYEVDTPPASPSDMMTRCALIRTHHEEAARYRSEAPTTAPLNVDALLYGTPAPRPVPML